MLHNSVTFSMSKIGCVPLDDPDQDQVIQDHWDDGTSKELTNPCPEWSVCRLAIRHLRFGAYQLCLLLQMPLVPL